MEIIEKRAFDFLGKRKIAFVISGILSIVGLIAALAIPLGRANLGTDFSGGVAVQLRFEKPFSIEEARKMLEKGGLPDAALQEFAGTTRLLVRVRRSRDLGGVADSVGGVFRKDMPDNPFTVDSTTEVGPTVGKKLQRDALWAVIISLAGILVYVAWRFEFRFGVAAVAATFHDVLAILGVLFILNKEITLLIITALLTLAGYSLTDTVVVFDRIRENMRKHTKEDFTALMNRSINEVFGRTMVTSGTTLLSLFALLIIGGDVIFDFALALFLGVVVGTYSSIFVASPLLLLWKGKKVKTGKK
ncbi:MAG: protein translocase subunit SecF [Deltaproteobacteria bacterium]|nr:protein translocase subunit SecF [Deltaproteobacteria bacterium]